MSPSTIASDLGSSFVRRHQNPYMPMQHESDTWALSSESFPRDGTLLSSSFGSPMSMTPFTGTVHSSRSIEAPLHRPIYSGIVHAPRDLMDYGVPTTADAFESRPVDFASSYGAPFVNDVLV